jgi:hypothetical protein
MCVVDCGALSSPSADMRIECSRAAGGLDHVDDTGGAPSRRPRRPWQSWRRPSSERRRSCQARVPPVQGRWRRGAVAVQVRRQRWSTRDLGRRSAPSQRLAIDPRGRACRSRHRRPTALPRRARSRGWSAGSRARRRTACGARHLRSLCAIAVHPGRRFDSSSTRYATTSAHRRRELLRLDHWREIPIATISATTCSAGRRRCLAASSCAAQLTTRLAGIVSAFRRAQTT